MDRQTGHSEFRVQYCRLSNLGASDKYVIILFVCLSYLLFFFIYLIALSPKKYKGIYVIKETKKW